MKSNHFFFPPLQSSLPLLVISPFPASNRNRHRGIIILVAVKGFEIPAPYEFHIGFNVNKGTAAREKSALFHIPVHVSANEVI